MKCWICGEETKKLWPALWEHLKPIDWEGRYFIKGNYQTFGLRSVITLMSPLLNTIIHWKYRKHRLRIEPFSGVKEVSSLKEMKEFLEKNEKVES